YIGAGTLLTDGSSCTLNSSANLVCPEKGGTYLNLGADVIFKKRFGAAFDFTWKASQGDFAGLGIPYRPLLFTFNGVYQRRLSKKIVLDVVGGAGWQSTRVSSYQTATSNCAFFDVCYTSSNHFLIDAGVGIRYYVRGHLFVRPEARFFHILNNTDTSGAGIG